jgi:hypothetical protein
MRRAVLLLALFAFLPVFSKTEERFPTGTWAAQGWTPGKWFQKPLSPRLANYRIEASLDFTTKTLKGSETITWKNGGTAPTDQFPLHLYLNAFKGPQTLFYKESGGGKLRSDGMGDPTRADSWGYCRLMSVQMEGRDLQGHAGEDETVWWVQLPRAVAPGQSISVDIAWESRFPKVFARSGWGGDFLLAGQWFPKVGVYQGASWNCHAYHAFTEFFSDFGVYDVNLSVPNTLRVASTGTAEGHKESDGNLYEAVVDPKDKSRHLYKIHAEDVHDFAFAVMPKLTWPEPKTFFFRNIAVTYYYQDKNGGNLQRQRRAVEAALRLSEEWYFKYPYPVLSVVDVPDDAKGADGMEYPTFITSSSTDFDPIGVREQPEVVAVHEYGHQYFYGLLASNEFEEAWLDEGINSWFTHKVMDATYHGLLESRRLHVASDFGEWAGYWADPSVDPLTQFGFKVRDQGSYFRIAYAKPTMVLNQLEALVGRETMLRLMRAYAQEMAFKHPTRHDFKRIAERESGRDLSGFFRDFVEGTGVLDYAIGRVETQEVQQGGWMDGPKGPVFAAPQQVRPGRRGSVVLLRKGDLVAPITLWVRLENREERRVTWDGRDRWARFEFESPVTAAVLDPDGNHPLLKDRLHASWTPKPARSGFHYWAQMVWGALVGLAQSCGIG